jgi:hypothetical protein
MRTTYLEVEVKFMVARCERVCTFRDTPTSALSHLIVWMHKLYPIQDLDGLPVSLISHQVNTSKSKPYLVIF